MSSSVGRRTSRPSSSSPREIACPVSRLRSGSGSGERSETRPSCSETVAGALEREIGEGDAGGQAEADRGRVALAVADVGGRAGGDDPAAGDHGDAVGELLGLLHVVGGEEDRLAEVAQARDHAPCLAAGRRVEAGGRLVEEEQLGVADQRDRDVEAALLAAGELAGALVRLLAEADVLDRLVDRPRRAVVPGVEP